ncbi:MAG: CubicO group peptidase (beta-lactamase class C family), partial [Candidatus Endobugula sp.]
MKTKLLSLLLVLFIFSCQTTSENKEQWLAPASPASVGFNSGFEAQLDNYITKAVNDTIIPGGTFLIAKDGKVIYEKSFGKTSS